MDEQEKNDQLEVLAGGIDAAFRLNSLWTVAVQTVSGDRFKVFPPKRNVSSVFVERAKLDGFSRKAIEFYVNHF